MYRAEVDILDQLGADAWSLWWSVVSDQLEKLSVAKHSRDGAIVFEHHGSNGWQHRFIRVAGGRISFHEGVPASWDAWVQTHEAELYRTLFLPECKPTFDVRGDRNFVADLFGGLERVASSGNVLALRSSK